MKNTETKTEIALFRSNGIEIEVPVTPEENTVWLSQAQMVELYGRDVYPTIEEKAANLLYFVTKNHSFLDGNKRIAG